MPVNIFLPISVLISGKARRVVVYSVRYDKEGNLTNAKPCCHCTKFLRRLGMKSCVYSDENGGLVSCKLSDLSSNLSSGNRY